MGLTKGYKYKRGISQAQREQRMDAAKSRVEKGNFSLARKELGKCSRCPIRDECTDREEKKNMVKRGSIKVRGCNQMRILFKRHLLGLGGHEKYLLSDIARLQAKLEVQEAKDGFEKVVFSPEWIKGKQLFLKQMELLLKMTHNKGKRQAPINIQAEVVEFNAPDEEDKHFKEGKDMYIPPPKPKPPILEIKGEVIENKVKEVEDEGEEENTENIKEVGGDMAEPPRL